LEVAETDRTPANTDIPQPFRPGKQLRHAPEAASCSAIVAIARAGDGEIDGEYQCLAAGLLGDLDHVFDEAAVLDEIELVPRHMARGRDFAKRTAADGRERHRNICRGRGARRLD